MPADPSLKRNFNVLILAVNLRTLLARALLLCMLGLLLPGASSAQGEVAGAGAAEGIVREDGGITINLRDADIRAFISSVADITGANFIVDPRVKGNVTVISSAPTDAKGLYEIFLSILKVHGFAAVPSGDVIKIVPEAIAKQEGQDSPPAAPRRGRDALVTAVIPVKHVSAPELVAILRPLLPQEAHFAGFAASNTLVVADSEANVQRLIKLIEELDVVSDKAIELVQLEHASADEVVRILGNLARPNAAQDGAPGAPGAQPYVAYPRTNTVLLQAAPSEMPRLKQLVRALDAPDRGPDQVDVVQLRFASAVDLVPVLQSVLSGQNAVPSSIGGDGQSTAISATSGSSTGIQADEATNTLIIQAPAPQLRVLRDVIAQLDVRRAQVLVEGIIAELTTQRADELGVQWQTSQTGNGIITGTLFPGTTAGAITDAGGDGVDSPLMALGTGLSVGYLSSGDIRVLLRALSADRYTNVLSTPTLMTLDNAEAEIVVGQNVPFVTGQFTNDATTPDNPFQTIERQDVGILLRVKPQINDGDTVTLELEQEVSSVDASTSGADLITNKRAIKTTVLVDDQNIVVLGGLIQNDLRENDQKVPLLGDIPLLGQLFKNSRSDLTKTNLMVFLRPSIVRDKAGNRETAVTRYEDLRARQLEADPARGHLLRNEAPELPALDGLLE